MCYLLITLFWSCTSIPKIISHNNKGLELKYNGTITIDEPKWISAHMRTFYFSDNGNIYIADHYTKKVHVFDKEGKKSHIINDESVIQDISNLLVLNNNHILIPSVSNNSISEFDEKGKYVGIWAQFEDNFVLTGQSFYLLNDSTFVISGSDSIHYWSVDKTKQSLLNRYTHPEIIRINKGSYYPNEYNNGYSFLKYSKSILVDNMIYQFVAISPFIRKLNLGLEFGGMMGVRGQNFEPVIDGFREEYTCRGDLSNLFQWLNGKSNMNFIFQHNDYILVIYKNNYRLRNPWSQDVIVQNENKLDDQYWCQVYSKSFDKYYGEILLPNRPIGYDKHNIYFPKDDVDNENDRIISTEINVKMK